MVGGLKPRGLAGACTAMAGKPRHTGAHTIAHRPLATSNAAPRVGASVRATINGGVFHGNPWVDYGQVFPNAPMRIVKSSVLTWASAFWSPDAHAGTP